ncbi:DUF4230 domain-containing protein [Pseudobutyrivibrio xylanivorans]|uniref:DUF4230 domain-containing protein n=1 Tax=Pseudobutyrivibrio xylanivorans DSM 14809 TaxID=1123012 RepID=A0A1M6JX59_PSEXY|nr:DUF4230 domain-containing protein [Pseudobutyrivibrio xylanivorans]SHJ51272.1 Protein of unknown function [Pseudobutyrivibrio xylanivorans DSM 14809]
MNKTNIQKAVCAVLLVATLSIIIAYNVRKDNDTTRFDDGIEMIEPNTIKLDGSGVRVSFSDVILSKPNETRKLVAYEVTGDVSYTIEDRMLDSLDWDPTKKYQTVTYKGKGSFVVDLDKLNKSNIIDDEENKVLTIKIKHPYLDTIEIDPDKVEIGSQKSGFFTIGSIKLTVQDYNTIEKELSRRLKESFNEASNGQKADDLALKAVYDIYEPVVKAVDNRYTLKIEFSN